MEDIVGAAGALPALLGIILVPLIWSVPIALMTAELSTTYPETGGKIVWVEVHFESSL